jgi:hypothetical protein
MNFDKSIFGVSSDKLLGHIVSDSSITIDLEMVLVIQNLAPPFSNKEVLFFKGKINFVWRLILNFARMVNPIHNLLKND